MVHHSILRCRCYTQREGVVETSLFSTGPESVRQLVPPSTGRPRQSPIPSVESPLLGNFDNAVCCLSDKMFICIVTNACKICWFLKKAKARQVSFCSECSTQILPVKKWTSPSIQRGRPLPRPDAFFGLLANFLKLRTKSVKSVTTRFNVRRHVEHIKVQRDTVL